MMDSSFLILKTDQSSVLQPVFLERYPKLPSDYMDFLEKYSLVINVDETTWFTSVSDFNGEMLDCDFAWNEFELQSLAVFDGDVESQYSIREFWNNHLPIVLSVKGGYSFFALNVSKENFGKVYFGEEPEYEEVIFVADSFTEFFNLIRRKGLASAYQNLF